MCWRAAPTQHNGLVWVCLGPQEAASLTSSQGNSSVLVYVVPGVDLESPLDLAEEDEWPKEAYWLDSSSKITEPSCSAHINWPFFFFLFCPAPVLCQAILLGTEALRRKVAVREWAGISISGMSSWGPSPGCLGFFLGKLPLMESRQKSVSQSSTAYEPLPNPTQLTVRLLGRSLNSCCLEDVICRVLHW